MRKNYNTLSVYSKIDLTDSLFLRITRSIVKLGRIYTKGNYNILSVYDIRKDELQYCLERRIYIRVLKSIRREQPREPLWEMGTGHFRADGREATWTGNVSAPGRTLIIPRKVDCVLPAGGNRDVGSPLR